MSSGPIHCPEDRDGPVATGPSQAATNPGCVVTHE
jgi:hypothetical protein